MNLDMEAVLRHLGEHLRSGNPLQAPFTVPGLPFEQRVVPALRRLVGASPPYILGVNAAELDYPPLILDLTERGWEAFEALGRESAAKADLLPALSESLQALVDRSAAEYQVKGEWVSLDALAYDEVGGAPYTPSDAFRLPQIYGGVWSGELVSLTPVGLAIARSDDILLARMARLARICADLKLADKTATISKRTLIDQFQYSNGDAIAAQALAQLIPGLSGSGQLGDEWELQIHRNALSYRNISTGPELRRHIIERAKAPLREQAAYAASISSSPASTEENPYPSARPVGSDPEAAASTYHEHYERSWALVVGINSYSQAAPLDYARQDAEAFAAVVRSRFQFGEDQVQVLLDEEATKANILSAYGRYSDELCKNDRLIVFFAGHGWTKTGQRGEVGFLIPQDGHTGDITSLIRWDELTRGADLIPAKHIFFIMDACYGGSIFTRGLPGGGTRFLRNMLQRRAVQALAAGKADETVSDSGGPRPGHSVFTGHLLDALEGATHPPGEILTATGVSAYVYDHVSRDEYSRQTPHYGSIDGDGDFIFSGPDLHTPPFGETTERDVLFQIPASEGQEQEVKVEDPVRTLKRLLSASQYRIELDDFVLAQIRQCQYRYGTDAFDVNHPTAVTTEAITARLQAYEMTSGELISSAALLGKWADGGSRASLERLIARLPDTLQGASGVSLWLALRWYPSLLVNYAAGIAAMSVDSWENLATVFLTRIDSQLTGDERLPALPSILSGFSFVRRSEAFKQLPGHERHYTPESEYIFKLLQAPLDDVLFLGSTYESLFDRFEVFLALVYAYLRGPGVGGYWAPIGRFGWKERRGYGSTPFTDFVKGAEAQGENWPPLSVGFFGGSIEMFSQVANGLMELLRQLPWV